MAVAALHRGDFFKIIAESGQNPRTIACDLLIVDAFDKYHIEAARGGQTLDQQLGDAAGLLPSVITGAQTFRYEGAETAEKRAEAATLDGLKDDKRGPTQAISHIVGDLHQIAGSKVALLPVPPLRAQSLFGFVDDIPSSIDGVHYLLPMVMRVNDSVYPSLALQAVGQVLHVDPDGMTVNIGRDVVLKNSDGKTWTIRSTRAARWRSIIETRLDFPP